MMRKRSPLLSLATLLLIASASRADYIITPDLPPSSTSTVPTITLTQGGTATVNFYIYGDATTPGLIQYGAEFQITPVAASGATVKFTNVQPDSYLDHSTSPTNYVLLGNSAVADSPPPPNIGNGHIASRIAVFNSSVSPPQTDLTIADTTDPTKNPGVVNQPITLYNPAAPQPNGNQLLAQFTITAPATALGTYQLALVGQTNGNTYFDYDPGTGPQDYGFTSTPLLINVVASGVPEPSSLALAAVGLAAVAAGRLRARRA